MAIPSDAFLSMGLPSKEPFKFSCQLHSATIFAMMLTCLKFDDKTKTTTKSKIKLLGPHSVMSEGTK